MEEICSYFLVKYIPLRVRKSPMIAMTRSLATGSILSPRRVLTLDSLLKIGSEMSRHKTHADAAVCSFTNGDAILKYIINIGGHVWMSELEESV